MNLQWTVKRFDQLDTAQLYHLLRLRVDVFVVEQACIYPELDGLDILPDTLHLLGLDNGVLVAYARAMAPLESPQAQAGTPVKIGRVVLHPDYRQKGIAREMMDRLLEEVQLEWPHSDLFLSAQTRITGFYESLGFHCVSAEYVEDGIPHIDMRRERGNDS